LRAWKHYYDSSYMYAIEVHDLWGSEMTGQC
jgi:hypothetical protein